VSRGNWIRLLQASLRIQLRHKLRSALALLGVILGAGAVVAMVGIARAGHDAILEQIEALGTNVLVVSAAPQRLVGGRSRERGTVTTLVPSDGRAIALELRDIVRWAAVQSRRLPVKYGSLTKTTPVVGASFEYFEIRELALARGRLFDPEETSRRVAVLGSTVARDLFGAGNPVGERVKINRVSFDVVGVLSEQGQVLGAAPEDDRVYVPLQTAMRRLFNVTHLEAIVLQVRSRDKMRSGASAVKGVMREAHRLSAARADDFTVLNQKELLDVQTEAQERLNVLTSAIAAVSLLVGGIGILAIMTMSVKERTREIGVRRAIGAKRRDVFWQFLLESALLSLLGGALGVLLGLGVLEAAARVGEYRASVDWPVVGLAFAFAVLTGVVFGIYPSVRAARLVPIAALRYE